MAQFGNVADSWLCPDFSFEVRKNNAADNHGDDPLEDSANSDSSTINEVEQSSSRGLSPIERYIVGIRAKERANEKVQAVFAPFPELKRQVEDGLAKRALFSASEIKKGRKLGTGGFASVYEIKAFKLSPRAEKSCNRQQRKARARMIQNVKRENPYNFLYDDEDDIANYAIKHIKPSLMREKPQGFVTAAGDLAIEAKLMLAFDHPNILKVRGLSKSGHEGFSESQDGFFLIVDRLRHNLEQQLALWKFQLKKYQKMNNFLFGRKKTRKLQSLLTKRLKVAHDIASAMEYLHDNNVIFRDCKSANIGLDLDGKAVLFDFGLARPLEKGWDYKEKPLKPAGSYYYMAPEAIKAEPYNLSADVYSFGCTLWEIMECQCCLDREDPNLPLPISSSWPDAIQDIVRRCLAHDMDARPSMKQVRSTLSGLMLNESPEDVDPPSLEFLSPSEDSFTSNA